MKISQLLDATALKGTERLPLVQDGKTRSSTIAALAALLAPLMPAMAKGDPGGNSMAIGLFAAAAALAIPAGTDLVQTSGCLQRGLGVARYAFDPAIDAAFVAAHPRTSFLSANGRGFALAEAVVDPLMTGAAGAGADDTAAVQAALDTGRDVTLSIVHTVTSTHLATDGVSLSGAGGLVGAAGANGWLLWLSGSRCTLTVASIDGFNADFTGSTDGSTLTVTALDGVLRAGSADGLVPGTPIDADGLTPGTAVMQQLDGTPGGAGTYRLNKAVPTLSARAFRHVDRPAFGQLNDLLYVTGADNLLMPGRMSGSAGGGISIIDGARNHVAHTAIENVYTNGVQVANPASGGCSISFVTSTGTVSQNNIFVTASAGSVDNGARLDIVAIEHCVCEYAGDTGLEIGYHVFGAKVIGGSIRYSTNPGLLLRDCRGAVVLGTTIAAPLDRPALNDLVGIVPQHEGASWDYQARIMVMTQGQVSRAAVYVGGTGVDLSGSQLRAWRVGTAPAADGSDLMGSGVLLAGAVNDVRMIGGEIDGFAANVSWNFDGARYVRENCQFAQTKSSRTGTHHLIYNCVPVRSAITDNRGDKARDVEAKFTLSQLSPSADQPDAGLLYAGNRFSGATFTGDPHVQFEPSDALNGPLLLTAQSGFVPVPAAQYGYKTLTLNPLPGVYTAIVVGTEREITFVVSPSAAHVYKIGGSPDMSDDTGFGLSFRVEAGALNVKQYDAGAPADQWLNVSGPGLQPIF